MLTKWFRVVSDPDVPVLSILGQNFELTLKIFKIPGSGPASGEFASANF